MKFIDDLRLNSLILDEDEGGKKRLRSLNNTEIDGQTGARTCERRYGAIWTHWGAKDFSFLYRPD